MVCWYLLLPDEPSCAFIQGNKSIPCPHTEVYNTIFYHRFLIEARPVRAGIVPALYASCGIKGIEVFLI